MDQISIQVEKHRMKYNNSMQQNGTGVIVTKF